MLDDPIESVAMQELDTARMKERREALALTQTEAATRAGMKVSRWNDVEVGERTNVTLETLAKIAAALECDARDLITPAEPKKPRRAK